LNAGFSGRERLAAELRAQKFDVGLLLQNAFDAAWLLGALEFGTNRLCSRRPQLSSDEGHTAPRHGEIPAHEKFYYLELLRRAGWLDSVQDETFISLRVSEEKRRSADEFLCKSGARKGALRIAIGAGASYGSAKCWPPPRFAEVANRLQSEADADVILFELQPTQASRRPSLPRCVELPLISQGKPQLPICPRCSRSVISHRHDSGAMHVAAAVGLPVIAVLVPPIRREQLPSRRGAASFSKKSYCSHVFSALPDRSPVLDRNHGQHGGAAARPWLHSTQVQRA